MRDAQRKPIRPALPWRHWAWVLTLVGTVGSGCGGGSEPGKSNNPALRQSGASDSRSVPPALPVPSPAPAPSPSVAAVPAAAAVTNSPNELAMVLGSAVNVRPGAGTSNQPLGRIHCGDLVAVRGRDGDWLKIQLGELAGYAHSAYLVEVKAGQGTRPTCEFAHRGITAPHHKKPEPMPTGPSPSAQAGLAKIAPSQAVPEQVAVAAATLPAPAPASPAVPGKPAPAAPAPPTTAAATRPPPVASKENTPPQMVWLSTHGVKPKVMFPHPHHAQMFACAKCHHPLGSPGPNQDKDCHTCHQAGGKGQSPVSNKDAFHQTCRACHEATGRGPTACQECHSGGK